MSEFVAKRVNLYKKVCQLENENEKVIGQITQLRALANLGLVLSMAAHEINNVLTPIGNYAQLALDNPDDIELTKKVQKKTVSNCYRAQKILQSLLNTANKSTSERSYYNFQTLVDNVFDFIARDFTKDRIKVEMEIESDLEIFAIDVDIEHLLMNLILNARDAMALSGGILLIKAYNKNDSVNIEVHDSGKGIDQQELESIFEPFYTTKKQDDSALGGCGLGLTFCKQIVDEYQGSIMAESNRENGTVFKIIIPNHPSEC